MTMTSTIEVPPRVPAEARTVKRPGRNRIGGGMSTYYWMVIPAVLLFFVLHTVPVLIGLFFSFTDYAGYGAWNFVGLRNYFALFIDDQIWAAYGFTFLVAIVSTLLVNVIALTLAVGLNSRIKLQAAFRGIFFIPFVLAILVIGYVFQYLFSTTIPKILPGIPILGENILASPEWAWAAIVVLTVWQGTAFATILYLAGLQTIPGELYEAAAIDGTGKWKQFWHITFPMIGAFFTINMVLSMKTYLQVFDQIVALTNGGPGTSTYSVTFLIFRNGFQSGEYAYQTANAVVYLLVIVAVSLVQFRFLQRREAEF
jgi:raffinose/stachyose/melibiose transport system permease protein